MLFAVIIHNFLTWTDCRVVRNAILGAVSGDLSVVNGQCDGDDKKSHDQIISVVLPLSFPFMLNLFSKDCRVCYRGVYVFIISFGID